MKEVIETIYKAIKVNSNFIIEQGDKWTRELAGAKNYIATPDLKHWTFGKSVGADGEYHYNGGVAKQYLYSLGFINILKLNTKKSQEIFNEFKNWSNKVKHYPIWEKFERDQNANKRFELLVHRDVIKINKVVTDSNNLIQIQNEFNEGFKKQIIQEVAIRDKKVIQLAKAKHGTTCIICKFDFAKTYGIHGAGFIEMHHLFPIAMGKRKTTIEDLRPVCPNCHRMLHKGKKVLSIEELLDIYNQNNS